VKSSYVNNANSKFIFYLEKDPNYKPNIIVPDEVIEIVEQPIEKDTSAFSVDQFSANNIVFLLDISGSMGVGDKLSLMKYSLKSLVEILRPVDRVAMISYANEAKVLLPTTSGDHKSEMIELVDGIVTGGKTSGGKGFKKAFQLIKKGYIEGGNNQLIVITDGAFAIDDQKVIEKLVAKAAKKGIVTTVVAIEPNSFAKEKLLLVSQAGNGSLLPIEDEQSAERILIEEIKKQSAK
jgi:Ca-activated chloride channel family protein